MFVLLLFFFIKNCSTSYAYAMRSTKEIKFYKKIVSCINFTSMTKMTNGYLASITTTFFNVTRIIFIFISTDVCRDPFGQGRLSKSIKENYEQLVIRVDNP